MRHRRTRGDTSQRDARGLLAPAGDGPADREGQVRECGTASARWPESRRAPPASGSRGAPASRMPAGHSVWLPEHGRYQLVEQLGEPLSARRLEAGRGVVRAMAALVVERETEVQLGAGGVGRRGASADPSGCCSTTTSAPARASARCTPRTSTSSPPGSPIARRRPVRVVGAWRIELALTHLGHTLRTATAAREPVEQRHRLVSGDAVGRKAGVRWNSVSARAVEGPKMPSTRPGSNPSIPSRRCSSATSSPRCIGRRR